jgi:NAD(P)-dependent dehydrogenase (short-subunit alcohol dehydrogenase family)
MNDSTPEDEGLARRDFLKSMGVAAAAGGLGVAGSSSTAEAAEPAALGPYATLWDPVDPAIAGRQNIVPVPDDFFVPGRFAGKTALVTGCARGMGRLAAIRLAREGANVVAVDWLADEGKAVVDGIVAEGGKAIFVEGDISETAVCDAMVKAAVDTFGGLDCALNNAGVMDAIFPGDAIDYATQKDLTMARIDEAPDAYWDVVMRVNATGTFRSLRSELRQMLAQGRGGSIVNVASVAGLRGFGGTPSYVASKHAVNGLTKNAAIDYAPYGIRVNSVCMGTTLTPMYERAFTLLRQRAQSGFRDSGLGMMKINSLLEASQQPKRGSTAAEQVAVMLFLLSPESSNLTGANYATDGGFTSY